MDRSKQSPWQCEPVIDYILEAYGGTEENERGIVRRAFIWADRDGDVWIGNVAAFAEHLAEVFRYELRPFDYVNINRIMIDVGERIKEPCTREQGRGSVQQPMAPVMRKAK